jgi:Bacterial Ig domain
MPRRLPRPLVRVGAIALLAVIVSACGGGGGHGGGGPGGTPTPPANPPPVLGTLSFTTKEATDLSAQVTATDPTGEALTFASTSNPSHGTLVSFGTNGAFVYRPTPGVTGDDTFGVRVTDAAGNQVAGTVTITVHANRPPTAVNDVQRADGAALDSINVLKNDSDADGDTLTVSIEGTPLVGNATINADSTVRISGLPSDFKGVTRFKYRVTDTSGASAVAAVAVFVGTDAFRVFFAQDVAGSGPEVFVNDMAADPSAVTTATSGTLQLRGFVVSDNGATVVYRREDTAAPTTSDLSFIQPGPAAAATKITLPAGATLPLDSGADQFRVSPDGKWIALVANVSGVDTVYVINTASPATLTKVSPTGTASASHLRFSHDSQNLYFLATADANGANRSLYTVSPANPVATVLVSALSPPNTNDDVIDYGVSPDQARVLLQANRGGRVGLYFIDARHLQTEVQVSHVLAPGDRITDSTLTHNGGTVSSPSLQRVAYTVQAFLDSTFNTYVADLSATPNPRLVASKTQVIGLRPDDAAVLYFDSLKVKENSIGAGTTDQLVEAGSNAWYDSTGNIVLIQRSLPAGGSASYQALAVTTRGTFGTSVPLGTPGMAALYFDVSGFDRGVVLVGEGATTGPAPSSTRVALVNALAPDKLFYLTDQTSPQHLTSPSMRVVAAP